ncbi:hypothetical protein Asp14428_07480 [Actinoplanes sp. NBRC 14428]|nr:hypothetical protein Asp14428_07480 [Actinoplanes sp. NBRC 14428]
MVQTESVEEHHRDARAGFMGEHADRVRVSRPVGVADEEEAVGVGEVRRVEGA